jgi:erythromycin esterase-like protein
MWANREIVDLIEWLRSYNSKQIKDDQDKKVGFYGLDVYSLWESLDAVMQYLRKNYPDAMKVQLKHTHALNHIVEMLKNMHEQQHSFRNHVKTR